MGVDSYFFGFHKRLLGSRGPGGAEAELDKLLERFSFWTFL